MKKHVYHIGDKVRIINSMQIVRVGYPLTIDDIQKTFPSELQEDLFLLIQKFYPDLNDLNFGITGICKDLLKAKGWGGNERKIYKEAIDLSCYDDLIFTISSKRYVQTGVYCHGHYDEFECSPPYLDEIKVHVILQILGWEFESCDVEPI